MDRAVDSQAGDGDPTTESTIPQPPATQTAGRKKGTSCARCRRQKVRCDDNVPSCGNCSRAGQVCIRTHCGNNPDVISHINHTEARIRFLEDTLRRVAPDELAKLQGVNKPVLDTAAPYINLASTANQSLHGTVHNSELDVGLERPGMDQGVQSSYDGHHHPSPSHGTTTSPSASTQIGPNEPLAHEVGLLSLANSKESKYLGPSSGVPFARLIFSAIPPSQGLATNWTTSGGTGSQGVPRAQSFPLSWASEVDVQHFVDAYFETHHPLHPFIDEDAVSDRLEILYTKQPPAVNPHQMPQLSEIESAISPMYSAQILLIIALGARVLETRLSADFSSERYLAAAQARIASLGLPLHDTVEGLQIMLLLTLSGFYFENGPNAWFLSSNIIASCLDLGFQRRWVESVLETSAEEHRRILHQKNIRSAIFWSSYSIERNLAVVLGRPLTLRDEAIDVEFPGEASLPYKSSTGQGKGVASPVEGLAGGHGFKRPRIDGSPYAAAHYSFRLDRIVAEIKLMLHRVVNLPDRFPWPTDVVKWQKEAHGNCDSILDEVYAHLKWRPSRRSTADITIRSLELKYHHNLMLLHRPSPTIPRPSIDSWKTCYNSAVKTILIYSELHRFSKLANSWLTAHAVFVSGITFVYCLWAQPQIKKDTSLETFERNAAACETILSFLGRTWSVAADAVEKFKRLAHMTARVWRAGEDVSSITIPGVSETSTKDSTVSGLSQDGQSHETTQPIPMSRGMNTCRSSLTDQCVVDGERNEYELEPNSFYTELGDMSAWFDLDWILSMNTGPSGEVISYPAL